jgi:hypothetical protein
MRNVKILHILNFIVFYFLMACTKQDGGMAPNSEYDTFTITPTAIIVPKSTTFKIKLTGSNSNTGQSSNVALESTCTSNNPIATIDKSGNLGNNYSGSDIQKAKITCAYKNFTQSADVTIVPATLTSLILTKVNLSMGPSQSQSIKVYGNFTDVNSYVFALEMTDYVTWTTDNAAVSQALMGTVSSGINGTANITASFGVRSASTSVTVSSATSTSTSTPKGPGLLGSYYDFGVANPSSVPWKSGNIGDPFERLFGQRIDSQVYFDWSTGINNLGQPYYFGIRWTGRIYIPTSGSYQFFTRTDDGVRVWIDDLNAPPIIDNWTLHAATEDTSAPVFLTGGQFYNIKIEYFENAGYSVAELRWQGPSITKQLIPQVYLFPD